MSQRQVGAKSVLVVDRGGALDDVVQELAKLTPAPVILRAHNFNTGLQYAMTRDPTVVLVENGVERGVELVFSIKSRFGQIHTVYFTSDDYFERGPEIDELHRKGQYVADEVVGSLERFI